MPPAAPAPPDDSHVFRALLDATVDNVSVVDRELRYTHVSDGVARVLGLRRDSMIGKNWRELGLPAAVMETVEKHWRNALANGESARQETEIKTPSGPRRFEYVIFPIFSGSIIVGAAAISRDITSRSATEIELRRAQDRYRSFIAHSSEGIWRFELDEPIEVSLPAEQQVKLIFERAYLAECNDALAKMYGFEQASDIVGARVHQLMDPNDEANRAYLLAFVTRGYRMNDAESVEVDRFARRKYFLNSLTGVVEDGRVVRAWGVQRDITDQKAFTERLRLSEERLHALVDASAQVVWTTDAGGRLEWILPTWTELTGQTVKEAKGLGWFSMIHADDRAKARAHWMEGVAARRPYRHMARLRMRDGSHRWFSIRGAPVYNEDGAVREWVGSLNDIDAERRQEEMHAADQVRAEFIAEANDLFVRSLDYEATLRSLAHLAVPRLADWCAVDMVAPDGSLHRLAVEHIDPSKVRFAYEVQEKYPQDPNAPHGAPRVLRSGETDWMQDIPEQLIVDSAQSPEHAEVLRALHLRSYICTAIRVREEVAGLLTLVMAESGRRFTPRDVELAEALAVRAGNAIENARLYKQAVDANRAKDEFLATLSHELRTPLTAILGWANLLRLSNYDRDTMRTAVETIERSAKTQAAIIDDLLDVSRIITGKFQLNLDEVEAVRIVENVVRSATPAADAKRIEIDVRGAKSIVIRADSNRLQQIIWNLISNAVKFTPEGGRISVEVAKRDDDVVFSVADNGMGIRPDALPRVFDRFWQADSSSNRTFGGLGLGLAIVKHLVEMHGGTVEARSEGEGRGSTFVVTLPIGTEGVIADATVEETTSTGKSVLLVDDDDSSREIIARMLRHFGAAVTEAATASAAVDLAERQRFDLVLTDLAMPEHDGYWLLERVREARPDVPVAAITALGVADEQMADAGFASFVRKPVDPTALAELLR
ncbi:MAG TPA: ATP-binding protein [Thermoanaerobaculia bacterium]